MTQMPYWSPSRFVKWDQCPGAFKTRYVDGIEDETTEAMAFGLAVHKGLEAHYSGEDGIRAYRAAWKQYILELGGFEAVDQSLTGIGMDLIEQVVELGLEGVPERGFSIDTNEDLGAPIIGYVDLWGADGVIYDFKTTKGLWSQARAEKELWQPAIYTHARWLDEPAYDGTFEYIVLNRVSGQMQRFRRSWTTDDLLAQWNLAWDRMREIAVEVQHDNYVCHGKHGFCPECGDRWSHDHVCHASTPERIGLHGRSRADAVAGMSRAGAGHGAARVPGARGGEAA